MFATKEADGGNTTSLLLHELMEPDVIFAYYFERKPLEALHGGPRELSSKKKPTSAPNGYEK